MGVGANGRGSFGRDLAGCFSRHLEPLACLFCLPESSSALASFLYDRWLRLDCSVGSMLSLVSSDPARAILFEFNFSVHLLGDVRGLDAVDPSTG